MLWEVSTHAPVGGRDAGRRFFWGAVMGFNSRARWRARLAVIQRPAGRRFVSTHAPVGGRDAVSGIDDIDIEWFQLTRPWEGATLRGDSSRNMRSEFQLTRPWEGATTPIT